MRPEGRVRRKDGRRLMRREQEPVLDGQREEVMRRRHGRFISSHLMDDLTVPGLAWLIERCPDDDAGPEYMIVRVTPVIAGSRISEAAHGRTVRRDDEESAMGLILDATDGLHDVLIRQARDLLAIADQLA